MGTVTGCKPEIGLPGGRRNAVLSRSASRCVRVMTRPRGMVVASMGKRPSVVASTSARRLIDQSDTITDPYGFVEDMMTSCRADGTGCESVTAETLVKDIVEPLQRFTGLPVVDKYGRICGVISDKDVTLPMDPEE